MWSPISGLIIFLRVPESRPAAVPGTPISTAVGPRGGGGLRAILSDRPFIVFTAMNLLLALVFLQHASTLPIAMSHDGLSTVAYGWALSLNGALIVAGQLFIPRVIERRDRFRMLAVGYLFVGLGFGLTGLGRTAFWYALTVLVWTGGEMLTAPASAALIADLSPPDLRGRYQSVFGLSWSAAGFVAPVLGGLVQEHLGDGVLWAACAGLMVCGAAGLRFARPPERTGDRATTPRPVALTAKPDHTPANPAMDPARAES